MMVQAAIEETRAKYGDMTESLEVKQKSSSILFAPIETYNRPVKGAFTPRTMTISITI